jgi:hypothetical protein
MALGLTLPLTEMSTRNLPGGKGRSARKADNLTVICEPISRKCGNLDASRPVTGIALPVPVSSVELGADGNPSMLTSKRS